VMPFQSSARRRPALTSTRAPAGRAAGATPVLGQRG
jgi:hypothetical protein